MHVHALMPGLRELDNGQYEPVARSERYILRIPMDEFKFQDALRVYIGELTGEWYEDVTLPDEVWQAHTMTLSWHNEQGKLQVSHSSGGKYIVEYSISVW